MKKFILLTSMTVITSLSFSQIFNSTKFVANNYSSDKIIISYGELADFVKRYYPIEASFDSMVVERLNKKYFLLARDSKNGRTYAFRLRNEGGALFVSIIYRLNACKCDCMDIHQFITEKNKIIGCKEAGHIIAGAF